ncbi:MAG: hypothetical protein ABL921_12955 [Pirellula sp.]
MKFQSGLVGLFLLTSFSQFAFAHPGHGPAESSNSVVHYLVSPIHWLPLGIGCVLVFCIWALALHRFGLLRAQLGFVRQYAFVPIRSTRNAATVEKD